VPARSNPPIPGRHPCSGFTCRHRQNYSCAGAEFLESDNGYSWATQQTFYDSVLKTKHLSLNDFDAQIVSFYPFYSQDSSLADLSYTTHKMAERYQKPIVVGETDWPVQCSTLRCLSLPRFQTSNNKSANTTAYPFPPSVANISFSPAGQIEWTRSILDVVQKIPHGLGKGLFYWEPGYMNNTGYDASSLFS
jgi:arabinogalactan endo-1,4-beta-galactosidase